MKQIGLGFMLLVSIAGLGQNNPIFTGGAGDGWSLQQTHLEDNTIFTGGSGDGWALGIYHHEDNAIFVGGTGDGWASLDIPLFSLSIESNQFGRSFVAYPNPTNGGLTVKLGSVYDKIDITISDVLGKVLQVKTFDNTDTLSLTIDHEEGVYFVQVSSEGRTAVIKIVKNKS